MTLMIKNLQKKTHCDAWCFVSYSGHLHFFCCCILISSSNGGFRCTKAMIINWLYVVECISFIDFNYPMNKIYQRTSLICVHLRVWNPLVDSPQPRTTWSGRGGIQGPHYLSHDYKLKTLTFFFFLIIPLCIFLPTRHRWFHGVR